MNLLQGLIDSPLVNRIGWVLVHSLWQLAAVALVLSVVLSFLRNRSARASYAACCVAMMLTLVASITTFALLPVPFQMEPALTKASAPSSSGIPSAVTKVPSEPADFGVAKLEAEGREKAAPNSEQQLPADARVFASTQPALTVEGVDSFERWFDGGPKSWLPWAVLAWFIGVACLSLRNVGGWLTVQRLKSNLTAPVSLAIQESASRIARQLGLKQTVKLLQSMLVDSPQVIGAIRPMILLPASLICQLPPDQLESLLAHEIAHILRQDYLVNLLQCAIETLFFYHPGIWWISAQTRQQREYCCDDIAVSVTTDRMVYAKALAAVAGVRTHGLAPASSGGRTFARLQRLLAAPTPRAAHPSRWLMGITALTLCATATTFLAVRSHYVQAQAKEEANPAQDKEAEAEARAIQAVNTLKGEVRRDSMEPGNPVVAVNLDPSRVIRGPGVTDAIFKDLQAFKHLKTLRMLGAPVTDEGMKALKEIKSLEVLKLGATKIGDQGLKELSELKNLKDLDINRTSITDGGLAYLRDLPKLEILDIRHTRVTDVGLRALRNLPSLRTLHLNGAQVTDAGLQELEGLENLHWLFLDEPTGPSDGLANLSRLKRLTLLQITGPQVTDAVLVNIKLLPSLESLAIAEADVTDKGTTVLGQLKGLKHLALSHTLMTDEGLKTISELESLEKVSLARSAFTDAGIMHLKGLKNLQTLDLNGTKVTETGVQKLQKELPNCRIDWRNMPGLASNGSSVPRVPSNKAEGAVHAIQQLGGIIGRNRNTVNLVLLSGYQVTDEALKQLQNLNAVNVLVLGQSAITDEGLVHLKGLSNLQMLSLRHTRITDKGLLELKGLKTLQGLNLGYTKATAAGVNELRRALPRCRIVGPGPTEFGEEQRQPSPQTGHLLEDEVAADQKPPATPEEVRALETIKRLGGRIAREQGGLPYLLNLSYTTVTDADLKIIKNLRTVRQILAADTGITDAGLKELQSIPRLRWLTIGNTKVTKEGLDQFKAALPECEIQDYDVATGEGRRGNRGGARAAAARQKALNAPASERELPVIAAVLKLGGQVERDPKVAGSSVVRVTFSDPAEVTAALLKDLTLLKELKGLSLNAPSLGNDDLKSLESLPNVESLSLTNTAVTDAGIKALRNLKKLKYLGLESLGVTGSTLHELSDLHDLQGLTLGGPQITNTSLKELKNLRNLDTLTLRFTSVTDAGLKELEPLPRLQAIHLDYSGVKGEGLKDLRSLKNLRTLGLQHSEITDAGLAELRNLATLESLDLGSTGISDMGLGELKGLTNLKKLNLLRINIADLKENTLSEAAVKYLQKALPQCQITGPLPARPSAAQSAARAGAGLPQGQGPGVAPPKPFKPVPAEKEKPAVQLIEKLGGQLTREPAETGQITQVDLRGTQVKDADLKVIKELTNLQMLYLGNTQITDAGLAELKGMSNLQFLGLFGANVTINGVKTFRTALPDCRVASPLGR